jgi:hypothetical protein
MEIYNEKMKDLFNPIDGKPEIAEDKVRGEKSCDYIICLFIQYSIETHHCSQLERTYCQDPSTSHGTD